MKLNFIWQIVVKMLQKIYFYIMQKKASELTGLKDIALAGGSFLNILANSKIYNSSFFDSVSLPSAPNDAGISIGCAFWGAVKLKDQVNKVTTDRLGIKYELDIDIFK